MANARFAWGLELGNRALKAVKLAREGETIKVVDYDVIEHEHLLSNSGDNREQLIANAVATFVQAHNVKMTPVAIGVSGQSSFARFIKLPPVEPRQIPNIVRFEAIQQIPFPLEEVEWDFQLFQDKSSPDVEVGIFAMRKDLVSQHIKYFTDAGLDVVTVQMNPLAVYNAMRFDERVTGTTMVIDIGSENTDLIIAEGESVWLRSIPIGGNNFTEALVKSFKVRFEKAEEYKRNAATSKYGRQILQAMRPIFADLVAEIQRSIGFYSSVHRDSRIDKVIALGGTFRLPGLQKYLQQNLQLDVQKIDRLGKTPPSDAKIAAAMNENVLSSVSAYGLALQAMDAGKINSSLLPEMIRRAKQWKAKNKWFALAAACFVAGTGLAFGRLYIDRAQFSSSDARRAQTEIDDTFRKASSLSKQWQDVQNAGEAERKSMADVRGLTSYRDLWTNLYNEIEGTIPAPDPNWLDPAKRGDRKNRKQIVLDDIESAYFADLNPFLAMDNKTFVQQAVLVGAGRGGAPAMVSAPSAVPPTPDLPATPAEGGPDAVAQAAAIPQRGFLVTLHCMTPYSSGQSKGYDLINTEVIEKFRKADQDRLNGARAPNAPAPQYSIKRVLMARAAQLINDPERRKELYDRQLIRHNATGVPGSAIPGGGVVPGSGVIPGVTRPGATAFPGATGGMRPGMAPGSGIPGQTGAPGAASLLPPGITIPGLDGADNGGPAGADAMKLTDPLTGESIDDDWDVTILLAVVVDPPKPAPLPETQPAPDGQTPAAATPTDAQTPGSATATPGATPASAATPAAGAAPPTP